VQNSSNPPAKYFHRPIDTILNTSLAVRVGGSFTYPPPVLSIPTKDINRLVLIAGGVGINPLISILSHLIQLHPSQRPEEIHFLYGSKTSESEPDPQTILFLPRLMDLVSAAAEPLDVTLSLFLTGPTGYEDGEKIEHGKLPNRTWARRIGKRDLVGALDGWRGSSSNAAGEGREGTVCYVCGPQKMTDEIVEMVGKVEGMNADRVLCEKWW
jgi:NAD(P)H-flavin reductase